MKVGMYTSVCEYARHKHEYLRHTYAYIRQLYVYLRQYSIDHQFVQTKNNKIWSILRFVVKSPSIRGFVG